MMAAKTGPFQSLIEESLNEAGFLWSRWEADLGSISRNLDEVWTWTECRLGGALDGVKLTPAAMLERLVADTLSDRRPNDLSACGHVLATSSAANARALLADALQHATGPRLRALLRGVEVADLDGTFAPVAKALARHSPEHAAALARLKFFRRAKLGEELAAAYESQVNELQIEALRAACGLPAPYSAAWVDAGLRHGSPLARLVAMETGIRQQVPNAWSAALATVRDPDAESATLLPLVAMLGSEAEQEPVFSALSVGKLQRSAIWALGNIGTRRAAEHCVLAMQHPNLARVAGEAYCAITGADMARQKLALPEPDEATPDFEADDLDADLVPAPQQLWPLPNAEAVKEHWSTVAAQFKPGVRYIRARPASLPVLVEVAESAPMVRRADYAFELYVRSQGKFDLEPRTTRQAQREMMALGRSRLAMAAS